MATAFAAFVANEAVTQNASLMIWLLNMRRSYGAASLLESMIPTLPVIYFNLFINENAIHNPPVSNTPKLWLIMWRLAIIKSIQI